MTDIHPYKDQIFRMWDFIKRFLEARENGFFLEAINLAYILMEIELRLLLYNKVDKKGKPIPTRLIDEQKFLMELANLAKKRYCIDNVLWEKIKEFNDTRKKAVHGLAQGKISYEELEEQVQRYGKIAFEIQSRWLYNAWS